MAFVYVIGGASPPYKVGFAEDPVKRLSALQTSSPFPLRIVMTAETMRPAADEAAIHLHLQEHRLTGEWFSCEIDEIGAAFTLHGMVPTFQTTRLPQVGMSAADFRAWLAEMSRPPFFAGDAKCAEALGLSANSILAMKERGCDRRTALACRALLHRLEPYGS